MLPARIKIDDYANGDHGRAEPQRNSIRLRGKRRFRNAQLFQEQPETRTTKPNPIKPGRCGSKPETCAPQRGSRSVRPFAEFAYKYSMPAFAPAGVLARSRSRTSLSDLAYSLDDFITKGETVDFDDRLDRKLRCTGHSTELFFHSNFPFRAKH